jgi:hypothetical protein
VKQKSIDKTKKNGFFQKFFCRKAPFARSEDPGQKIEEPAPREFTQKRRFDEQHQLTFPEKMYII